MAISFWNTFLDTIDEKKKGNPIYVSIVKGLSPVELKEDTLVLACDSNGAKKYIENKKFEIEEELYEIVKKHIHLELILEEKKTQTEGAPLLDFQPSIEDKYKSAGLNISYTFQNYAVSSTNQVAFAAAQAVAKSPGTSYNPLFLYGGVGVGKTHLAQAVARQLLEQNPETKVYFCPGDKFTNDLIESIRARTTAKFRRKYRNLDLIILDDIQFIAGKKSVQEEFFHTFNSIVSAGGQVVLASDRPPYEIRDLEDRLRSRFSGGLIVDIQSPDFELRTAILLIKAKEKNIQIEMEAAKAISDTVSDVRSLEGTLLSLYARSLQTDGPIDLNLVEDFFQTKTTRQRKTITPQAVIKTICSFYDVKQSHLKGKSRKSHIALTRQIAMFILRTELNLNLEEVAQIVNRKDHTTVIHAVDKVRKLSIQDPLFKSDLDKVIKSLLSST